jgi:membrane associated rhomboid family serine protease
MIFAVSLAIAAGLVTASARLSGIAALDVSRVVAGELWRIFTCHGAHLSWRQYAADAPAFVLLLAAYVRRTSALSALFLTLFASLTVSLAVVAAGVHQVYGGLSGLSCAVASALLCMMIGDEPRRPFSYLLAAAFVLYLLFMGGVAGGVRVAHEAHGAGTLSGLLFALSGSVRRETRHDS